MLFYDFEVFEYDWLVVITDTDTKSEQVFVNNTQALIDFYNQHKKDIWVGYNSRHYDQYIMKAIICGFTPQKINHWIITKRQPGWKFYKDFWKIQFYNYDVMTDKNKSLKQLEGFLGHDIRESTVDFTIDRPLTEAEIEEVIKYCRHDVHETMHIFMEKIEEFQSQMELLKMFNLPLKHISKTKAQLGAVILEAKQPQTPRNDEFDISFPPTLRVYKYNEVLEFYWENRDYNKFLEMNIAGVPTVFAWGGLHGARRNYYDTGHFINIDVASYYPAMMIEYDYLSRNVKNPEKFRQIRDTRLKYKSVKDKREKPLKIVINGAFGATKDKFNELYDPRQFNNIVIGGMTLMVDLIEMLEPYCQVIQANTDGILIKLYREEDYALIDDICYEWEQRTRMELEFESFHKVIQKDVNNYILVPFGDLYDEKGKPRWKSKGAYVKKLDNLDYDLPIVNQAIVDFFLKGIDPEETIFECTELRKFQKIVKVSGKYDYARYGTKRMKERVFRVFASIDKNDKELVKVKDGSANKISYTPERCFIINNDVTGMSIPGKLDYWWYLDLANERINAFLGKGE
ncbi:DNA polymerase [Bacillus sp. FJAT-29814]|uniref:DNA polymerase n=1 Tax=Bacillus sp. FJAT-29814 TaxID=1729688 RepID=UPI00082A1F19|nr:DNA polymerase [Bacillus sp. FJAT-29814]